MWYVCFYTCIYIKIIFDWQAKPGDAAGVAFGRTWSLLFCLHYLHEYVIVGYYYDGN